jgi:hypothetical protein|tara:strand:- start:343 stop:663 length:321 start_codon:yes stop_codon:yes gene_type:complete
MELLLIILVGYSISNIIVFGTIFSGLRETAEIYNPSFFGKLFTCMMCTPWWVGFFLSLGAQLSGYTEFSPFYSNGLENVYISIFLDSCLISGSTWLIHTVQEKLEE